MSNEHNNAPAVPQGWTKAADQVPLEADGEVFIRFTDGSIGTGWATYWHGASNEFAQWTFPDPDEDRTVLEWTKNPATPAPAPAQELVMPTDKQIIQAMTAEFPTPSLVPMLKGSVICGDFHKALVSAVNVGIAEFCRINGIGQPAQEVGLTEAERVRCLIASGCIGTVKMTYDSGPYEITRTSINASRLIDAIIAALRAKGAV